jgi:uncharacterized protein (TIGR01244 family)
MIEDIYNYQKLSDEISTAGQPTEDQFAEIAQAGFQTVVNLLPPESGYSLANEQRIVEANGMEYVYIPVIWQKPTLQNLREFCDAMDARAGRKVFVHCAANMRVSAFMALYRILRQGWEPEQAFKDMHAIWEPEGWWKEFIDGSLNKPE